MGFAFLAEALGRNSSFGELESYIACFVVALLTSTLKVRLPGITGTISMSFLFILIATAVFSFSETVLLAGTACIVQCFWKARRRPRIVQVSFNVAVLAISSGLTFKVSHLLAGQHKADLIALLAVATCCYFTVNTLLVSGVLSLVQGKSLIPVWRQCYMWSFPYYVVGAAIAGLAVVSSRSVGWARSLPILCLMFLVYVFYKTCVERMVQNTEPSRS